MDKALQSQEAAHTEQLTQTQPELEFPGSQRLFEDQSKFLFHLCWETAHKCFITSWRNFNLLKTRDGGADTAKILKHAAMI